MRLLGFQGRPPSRVALWLVLWQFVFAAASAVAAAEPPIPAYTAGSAMAAGTLSGADLLGDGSLLARVAVSQAAAPEASAQVAIDVSNLRIHASQSAEHFAAPLTLFLTVDVLGRGLPWFRLRLPRLPDAGQRASWLSSGPVALPPALASVPGAWPVRVAALFEGRPHLNRVRLDVADDPVPEPTGVTVTAGPPAWLAASPASLAVRAGGSEELSSLQVRLEDNSGRQLPLPPERLVWEGRRGTVRGFTYTAPDTPGTDSLTVRARPGESIQGTPPATIAVAVRGFEIAGQLSGWPVGATTVTTVSLLGPAPAVVQVDAGGLFRFPDLPPGSYQVVPTVTTGVAYSPLFHAVSLDRTHTVSVVRFTPIVPPASQAPPCGKRLLVQGTLLLGDGTPAGPGHRVRVRNLGRADPAVEATMSTTHRFDLVLGDDRSSGTVVCGGDSLQVEALAPGPSGGVLARRTVLLTSDTVRNRTTDVALFAARLEVPRPALALSGAGDFGEVTVGESADLTVSAGNTGAATLTIATLTVTGGGFTLAQSPALPSRVSPGGSLPVQVRFTPAATGPHRGSLALSSDAANTPTAALALSGTGVPVSRAAIALVGQGDFGRVTVGESADLTVSAANTGTATLTISAVAVEGGGFALAKAGSVCCGGASSGQPRDSGKGTPSTGLQPTASFAGGFVLGASAGLPLAVAPGARADVRVRFSPGSPGPYEGSLAFTSDAANAPVARLALRGTGVALEVRAIGLPGSAAFGFVRLGESADLTLSAANTGTATLTISAVGASGAGFAVEPVALPLRLAPGTSVGLHVRFTPPGAGPLVGTLAVTSDATNAPAAVVALTGTGISRDAPALALASAAAFAPVTLGDFGESTLAVSSTGGSTLVISEVTVSGGGFSLASRVAASTPVPPGASYPVRVRFSPAVTGAHAATLSVASNAANAPHAVAALLGSGLAREVALPRGINLVGTPFAGGGLTAAHLAEQVGAPWVAKLEWDTCLDPRSGQTRPCKKFALWFTDSDLAPFPIEPGRAYVLPTKRWAARLLFSSAPQLVSTVAIPLATGVELLAVPVSSPSTSAAQLTTRAGATYLLRVAPTPSTALRLDPWAPGLGPDFSLEPGRGYVLLLPAGTRRDLVLSP